MPGRPPKPTALKILQGNPGRRPLNLDEPQPLLGAKPPSWLTLSARREWDRLAPMLERIAVLTEADGDTLAILCTLLATFQAEAKDGSVSTTAAAEIRAYLGRFGMTPADRVRIKKVQPEEQSKLSRFISGKKV